MIRGRIFWGLVVLLVGILLLLENLGYLPGISIWGLIWPIFLIALGGWIIWNYYSRGTRSMEHISIPIEGAQRARIRFQHGAGRLTLTAGSSQDNLIEGDFGGGLDIRKSQNGDELNVRLKSPGNIFPFDWAPGHSLDWTLSLKRDIPLILSFENGANDTHLDLSDLKVTELTLKTGASSNSVTLPSNAGLTQVDIGTGAASVKVIVPEGVAARIRYSGGLSNVIVSSRFPMVGGVYQSPDYDNAANKANLDIEMGIGSVTVS